jgi:hypothetical protein
MHRWIPGILILSLTACMRPGAPSVPMPSTSFARTATPPMTSPPLGTSADRTMPSVPTSTPRPPTRTPAPTPTRTLIPPPPATPPAPWPNGFGTDPDWFSAFFPTIDPNTKWWHAQVWENIARKFQGTTWWTNGRRWIGPFPAQVQEPLWVWKDKDPVVCHTWNPGFDPEWIERGASWFCVRIPEALGFRPVEDERSLFFSPSVNPKTGLRPVDCGPEGAICLEFADG